MLKALVPDWLRSVFRRARHRHVFHDFYVFDSCVQYTLGTGERRIMGMAVQTICECGAMQRRPLKSWEEARRMRKRLPYLGSKSGVVPYPQARTEPD